MNESVAEEKNEKNSWVFVDGTDNKEDENCRNDEGASGVEDVTQEDTVDDVPDEVSEAPKEQSCADDNVVETNDNRKYAIETHIDSDTDSISVISESEFGTRTDEDEIPTTSHCLAATNSDKIDDERQCNNKNNKIISTNEIVQLQSNELIVPHQPNYVRIANKMASFGTSSIFVFILIGVGVGAQFWLSNYFADETTNDFSVNYDDFSTFSINNDPPIDIKSNEMHEKHDNVDKNHNYKTKSYKNPKNDNNHNSNKKSKDDTRRDNQNLNYNDESYHEKFEQLKLKENYLREKEKFLIEKEHHLKKREILIKNSDSSGVESPKKNEKQQFLQNRNKKDDDKFLSVEKCKHKKCYKNNNNNMKEKNDKYDKSVKNKQQQHYDNYSKQKRDNYKKKHFDSDKEFKQQQHKGKNNNEKKRNVTGEWYANLHKARIDIRNKEKASDWVFDRAYFRNLKRNKAHWYFQWMHNRDHLRV